MFTRRRAAFTLLQGLTLAAGCQVPVEPLPLVPPFTYTAPLQCDYREVPGAVCCNRVLYESGGSPKSYIYYQDEHEQVIAAHASSRDHIQLPGGLDWGLAEWVFRSRDDDGDIVSETFFYSEQDSAFTTRATYTKDDSGRILRADLVRVGTDVDEVEWFRLYTWNADGSLATFVNSGLGTYDYYSGVPNGWVIDYFYEAGRLVRWQRVEDIGNITTQEFFYDDAGLLIRDLNDDGNHRYDRLYRYDDQGTLIHVNNIFSVESTGSVYRSTLAYRYDADGRLLRARRDAGEGVQSSYSYQYGCPTQFVLYL